MPSHYTMLSFLVLALLCATSAAQSNLVHYSYSNAVGGGSGDSFSTKGSGRVTAVRVWEIAGSYITGIQLRHNLIWSPRVGRTYGPTHELDLFDNEVIVQISGKYYTNYIYQLIFVTSRGRSLFVGQPSYSSFNMYPRHMDGELKLLSGRYNGNGITSVAAHWGVMYMNSTTT